MPRLNLSVFVLFLQGVISIMFAAQPWVCSASAEEVDSSLYETPGQQAAENPERNPDMLLQLTIDMCIITGSQYIYNGQHLVELWADVWLNRMHDFLESLYLKSNSERQYSEKEQQLVPDYISRAYIEMTCRFLSCPHDEVRCGLLCVRSCLS